MRSIKTMIGIMGRPMGSPAGILSGMEGVDMGDVGELGHE